MSKIEWTEKTWNPSIGCTKVSQGCKNCYAEVMAKRLQAMGNKDYQDGFKFKVLPHRFDLPIKTKKPTTFFVNSMSDLFHEKIPSKTLDKLFQIMTKADHHRYQILTKRADLLFKYAKDKTFANHIMLGVTVENKVALKRIKYLQKIDVNRFLSIEPLLEDLGSGLDFSGIDWVIVGGESGHKARRMKAAWVEQIKDHCDANGIPFFFKQWGTYSREGIKRNKHANGRLLAGKEWNAMPAMS